jgi:hypothetical protein
VTAYCVLRKKLIKTRKVQLQRAGHFRASDYDATGFFFTAASAAFTISL